MENISFDEENIPLIQDDDYKDYRTPGTSRIDAKTSFTEHARSNINFTLKTKNKARENRLIIQIP